MLQFIASCRSLLFSALCRAAFPLIQFLRHTAFKLKGSRLADLQHPAQDLLKSNDPSGYADTCLTVQYQTGLEIIGVGTAGQVYNVDEDIVLKTCRIYEPPSQKATPRALWDYASETVFHFGLLIDERAILGLLAECPHPNIIEVIDADQPEGIYLRKYRPFRQHPSPIGSSGIRISSARFCIFKRWRLRIPTSAPTTSYSTPMATQF